MKKTNITSDYFFRELKSSSKREFLPVNIRVHLYDLRDRLMFYNIIRIIMYVIPGLIAWGVSVGITSLLFETNVLINGTLVFPLPSGTDDIFYILLFLCLFALMGFILYPYSEKALTKAVYKKMGDWAYNKTKELEFRQKAVAVLIFYLEHIESKEQPLDERLRSLLESGRLMYEEERVADSERSASHLKRVFKKN